MKVYLLEDVGNSPGKVYAVMAHEIDARYVAQWFSGALNTQVDVVERTIHYGQPPIVGYNP